MPETKRGAKARARKLGIKQSQVVKSSKGSYFIAPRGITTSTGKKTYAELRASGKSKSTSAKIAHTIDKKIKRR